MRSSWTKSALYSLRFVAIGLIGFYQKALSPLKAPSCRFYPSCSTYARLAIEKHGILRGGLMSVLRLSKCHPFHPGGFDPPD